LIRASSAGARAPAEVCVREATFESRALLTEPTSSVYRIRKGPGRSALSSEMEFKESLLDGPLKKWHSNGQLARTSSWVAGVQHGPAWEDDNGKTEIEAEYCEGKLNGPWQPFYENGQIEQTGWYLDDKEAGHWTTWSWDGQKLEEGDARHGKRHGRWTFWDDSGQLRGESFYGEGVVLEGEGGPIAKDQQADRARGRLVSRRSNH
jgi:antitoxin component YwqK of YwqJK toxin-antitoxin module